MRLQLIIILGLYSVLAWGQSKDSVKVTEDIDVNFLMSYYEQDGIHSAVTGGVGTEELEDFASMLIVNIPLDSSKTLTMRGGANLLYQCLQ